MKTAAKSTAKNPAGHTQTESLTPPKPPLAFRVGVVGHRPNRLTNSDTDRLTKVIFNILSAVQTEVKSFYEDNKRLFATAPPVLRAISPLAEGADRLFAEQALNLGWELCCVMPFPQDEYEKDFRPGAALEENSLTRFHEILKRAADADRLTRFQLDGSRAKESASYGNGGRVVLNQSDLLVAIWDGRREGKRGGTEETMDEARRIGVPVIWVDAHKPHAWQRIHSDQSLLNGSNDRMAPDGCETLEILHKVVHESLAVPEPGAPKEKEGTSGNKRREQPLKDLKLFYTKRQPRLTWAVFWKAFRDIVADSKFPKVSFKVEPFEQAVIGEWPRKMGTPVEVMVDRLRPFYAWPDKLAVLYSDRYRSAFIIIYLFTAAAVAMALAPIARHMAYIWKSAVTYTSLELVFIVLILLIVFFGRVKKWHEHWIDYRLAAELLRHLRVVAPIGGERLFPQVPAHHAIYGNPTGTWMHWYVHAVARSIGLPNITLDHGYLAGSLSHIEDLLDGQLKYHNQNARRSRTIEHRLHWGIVILLGMTIIACILHILYNSIPGNILTLLCGFFPALGASLAGINNQGEFRRIAKRSEAMQEQITLMKNRIVKLHERINQPSIGTSFAAEVSILIGDSARLLVQEVLDWRIVFIDRPLEVVP